MKILMAHSADGYLCMGPRDDMTWTGPDDKKIFRLLTRSSESPLLAGRTTAEIMPRLPKQVLAISRPHLTLGKADSLYPDAWLIGGPTIAREAILGGFAKVVFLVQSPQELYDGTPLTRITEVIPMTKAKREVIEFGLAKVQIFSW